MVRLRTTHYYSKECGQYTPGWPQLDYTVPAVAGMAKKRQAVCVRGDKGEYQRSGNNVWTANGKSVALDKYDPDTKKSAPAAQHNFAVSAFMPPSTDIL